MSTRTSTCTMAMTMSTDMLMHMKASICAVVSANAAMIIPKAE